MPENSNEGQGRGLSTLASHISAHKLDFCLWMTRILTLFYGFSYLLPLFVSDPTSAYSKCLLASAATSAIRLHQRIPAVQLNREFLGQVMLEDSAHYLLYCLIFMYASSTQPVTVTLMPVTLFALLHSASYSLTLLDAMGQNAWWGARMLISVVELHSRNILRMVAFTEIFLMPLLILLIFTGRVSLFTPFLYYRFLGLRYSSRRNPYTRNMFHELRVALEQTAASERMPQGVRNMTHKVINFVSNLAPQIVVTQ